MCEGVDGVKYCGNSPVKLEPTSHVPLQDRYVAIVTPNTLFYWNLNDLAIYLNKKMIFENMGFHLSSLWCKNKYEPYCHFYIFEILVKLLIRLSLCNIECIEKIKMTLAVGHNNINIL